MKNFKYICIVLMAFLFAAISANSVKAAGSATISIASASGQVGSEVSVNITISSDEEIGAADIFLSYDASMLEAVSGYDVGGSGTIHWVDTDTYKQKSRTVTFKILKAGQSSIQVTGASKVAGMNDGSYMELNKSSGTVTGNAPASYSSDNTLSSLAISPGELSPAFSPNVTEYRASVGADCDKLVVSAVANHSKASIRVSGTRMDPGDNITRITVTAENGSTRVYTIYTTKSQAQEQTEPTTAANEEPLPEIEVDNHKYQISSDFEAHPLPEGYESAEIEYNGIKLLAGVGAGTQLTLLYLESIGDDGISGFYVYDSVSNTYTLYNEVAQPDITYVILPITDAMEKPMGFNKVTEYTINDKKASVLMSDDGTYCLFYGVNSSGAAGWYCYNIKDKTICSYYERQKQVSEDAPIIVDVSDNKGVWKWKLLSLAMGIVAVVAIAVAAVLARSAVKNRRMLIHTIHQSTSDYSSGDDGFEEEFDDDEEYEDGKDDDGQDDDILDITHVDEDKEI